MIDDPLYLIVTFAAGLVLGAFYLGTLWLVLQRLHRARHPGIWIMGSTACRVGLLLTAWYWISGGKLDGLIACLLGFLVLRFGATRLARAGIERPLVP
jgi:F1F0 ATPase subunit 2